MKLVPLGKSDLLVSEISFGCMSLGDDLTENTRLLHQALDKGINFFDTADLYQDGQNEISVGKAFQDRRDRVFIATKVGNQRRADGLGWDWNPRKAYIIKAVEESLKRLQTNYIDLYQLHGGTIDDPIDETIEAFELLKEVGKIRHYGISSIRPNVIREYISRSNIVSVMMQYSLLDRRPQEEYLDLLHQHQISVLARGTLAKGLLAGKETDLYMNYGLEEVDKAAEAIHAQSTPDRSPVATAIRYVLAHPAVASAVVGIRTEEQLREAFQAGNAPELTTDEWQALASSIPANHYEDHR
ncbi:aldo/keto reductase [Tellurirhabdus bombi]|uniref:aldo/keto reductase n=1 Tax=Tellurirhabdus bombi TaxID=2907205 RepID=UPI001F19DD56|nr:aldo/keto reductase [Tellurirhabdus bombi]